MIAGVGIDMIEVDRIARALQRHSSRFLHRVYTETEIAYCWPTEIHRYRRLAARYAAKEATLKALGTGLRNGKWIEVEVVADASGKPSLRLSGGIAATAAYLGIRTLHLSMSHCREYALAQVVAEK